MPYKIESEHPECPASEPWGVVKTTDGELMGCHASQGDAQDQVVALLLAEEGDEMEGQERQVEIPEAFLERRGEGPERRVYPLQEIRVAEEGDERRIEGHAAVFDSLSVPMFGFRERIRSGAFAKTIQEADIRALWNHDPNFVFGRNRAGTLRLTEDDVGLRVRILPPETQWARDFMVSVKRGDVNQMSFSFEAIQEEWSMEDEEPIRELVEVRLSDVSLVTFPAYPATSVQVRAQMRALYDLDPEAMVLARQRLEAGQMTQEDRELLANVLRYAVGESDEKRGNALATLLNGRIESQIGDDVGRPDLIARLAREAEVAESSVRRILSGETGCPSVGILRAFARVLDVSFETLVNVAERDGCEYDARSGPAGASHPEGDAGAEARARLALRRRRLELLDIQ